MHVWKSNLRNCVLQGSETGSYRVNWDQMRLIVFGYYLFSFASLGFHWKILEYCIGLMWTSRWEKERDHRQTEIKRTRPRETEHVEGIADTWNITHRG